MKVITTDLPGVKIIELQAYADERGFFMETWNQERYAAAGLDASFVQDNLSQSRRGVLRGLHYQHPVGQGKLICALQGEVFDVAVDIRHDSPTFGRWLGITLSAANRRQLFIPPGFAHGFCVTSEVALTSYKCTTLYDPAAQRAILWSDPDIGIGWPEPSPTLSENDETALRLRELPKEQLPSVPARELVELR